MAAPFRQPFATLGGTRLRNHANMKNKQNALPTMAPAPLKRHVPEEFDDVDTENIDPLTFSSPSKKSRTSEFEFTKTDKTPLFTLTPAQPSQYVERARATPDASNRPYKNVRATPLSAPAPAGRSPTKGKKTGILSRRRMTSSPFTRINPPTFSGSKTGLPFSIDAALAGTIPLSKSKSTSTTHRKGWQFEIHEDTPDDEMANLMEHSTCTLDISDDESSSLKADKDNKENIPPVGAVGYANQISATRRDMMTDESRSPLGDLDAKDFYAEGCDSSSIIIIPAEDFVEEKAVTDRNAQEPHSPSCTHSNAVTDDREGWKDLLADIAAKGATTATEAELGIEHESSREEPAAIQIWESESAKGDDDGELEAPTVAGADQQSLLA
ncbi:hypothetical protein P7C71_g2782, partial [Lecanoromycetidae sp. Uapishka_2]